MLNRAAILSFYFLLALFPLLLFLTALLGYLADPGTQLRRNLLTYLSAIVPASAFDLINTTVDEISQKRSGGKLWFGLLTHCGSLPPAWAACRIGYGELANPPQSGALSAAGTA